MKTRINKNNPKHSITNSLLSYSLIGMVLLQCAQGDQLLNTNLVEDEYEAHPHDLDRRILADETTTCEYAGKLSGTELVLDKASAEELIGDRVLKLLELKITNQAGEEDLTNCPPPTHLYHFDMPFTTVFTNTNTFATEKFDATTAVRKVLNFRVGSATEYSKPIFKVVVTICGAETIAPTDGEGLVDLKTSFGTNKYWVTKDGWFDTMFTILNTDKGAGQSTECGFHEFDLRVDGSDQSALAQTDGHNPVLKITPRYNRFIAQEMLVSVEKAHDVTVILTARTKGGKEAEKTIRVKVNVDSDVPDTEKCVFSITPFRKETVIAFKPADGETTMTKQLAAPFRQAFEYGFSKGPGCKVD